MIFMDSRETAFITRSKAQCPSLHGGEQVCVVLRHRQHENGDLGQSPTSDDFDHLHEPSLPIDIATPLLAAMVRRTGSQVDQSSWSMKIRVPGNLFARAALYRQGFSESSARRSSYMRSRRILNLGLALVLGGIGGAGIGQRGQ